MAFALPYFFDYPPYFTLQLVQETRRKQSALWQDLILSYCRHHKVRPGLFSPVHICCFGAPPGNEKLNDCPYKVFKISLTGDELPIFVNEKINRRLSIETKRVFLEDLVAAGFGLWLGRDQGTCLILWKKLDAWAQTIYEWAKRSGMEDSVMTIDELSSGSEVHGSELQGAPRELLIPALRLLEKRGKARLFKGNLGDDDGVKFFP